jgi:hypothetical protein
LTAPPRWHADRRRPFYRLAAWGTLAVALAGFFSTYTGPMIRGSFNGPRWSHVHALALSAWLVLVIAQAHLATWRLTLHRRLGWAVLAVAPAVAVTTIAIGVETTRRDLATGGSMGMAGNVTAPLVFCALVAAALIVRGKPQWHKRLIVIASVVVIWPAWFRWRHFLPWVPRPDIALGLIATNLVLVVAMVRDRMAFGAVHPAYLWVGLPVIAWQAFETFAFGSPWWTSFGLWLYAHLP